MADATNSKGAPASAAPQMPPLPEWDDVRDKVDAEDDLTAIEYLVYEETPSNKAHAAQFRIDFQAALQEAFELGRKAAVPSVGPDDVKWIVNDLGELGVEVGGRCFFLYKGDSLEYPEGKHDDGTPMRYRIVGKAEFGEVCVPARFRRPDAVMPKRYTEPLVFIEGLSFGKPEDGEWRELPVVKEARHG